MLKVKKTPIQQLKLRVKRSAKRLPLGTAIYAFLQRNVVDLMAVADSAEPPVTAVSRKLIDEFGITPTDLIVKQFVGMAIKSILLQCNYVGDERGVRIPRDPLFLTGTTYKKVEPEPLHPKLSFSSVNKEGETLAYRWFNAAIPVMTLPERRALLEVLQNPDKFREGKLMDELG